MICLGTERQYKGEETGAQPLSIRDSVEVRTLVSGCSASTIFHPLISDSGFLLLRSNRFLTTHCSFTNKKADTEASKQYKHALHVLRIATPQLSMS